ncbi:MAG: response regulator, partial [Pseudomonadota bacterium]
MCDPEQVAIAIVDADSAVRDSFFPLLEGVGYSVCAYATGSDLLEALADHSPSVLLLGSQLPDINAHLLLKSVYDLGTKVPTIILANHSLELPRLEDMVPVPSA